MDERAKLNTGRKQLAEKKKAKQEGKDDLLCAKNIMDFSSFLLSHSKKLMFLIFFSQFRLLVPI